MDSSKTSTADPQGIGLPPAILRTLSLVVLILVSGFLLLASTRRLNFDEALALRAGWLLVEEVPGAPPFYMPTTLALGSLGALMNDPGIVFLISRLTAALSVCFALFLALRMTRNRSIALLTAVLIFSQSTFVIHGLEFRYDWAILIGLLSAYGLLMRARPSDFLWLGLCVSWLAAHHLKGAYFAVFVYLLATVAAATGSGPLRRFRHLNLGFAVSLAAWFALTSMVGQWSEFVSVYSTFLGLANSTDQRVWPWQALAETLRRDTVWWLGAAAAVSLAATKLWRQRQSFLLEQSFLTLMFALASLGFLFLHPHPWAYMLALAVPFLAILMAEPLLVLLRRKSSTIILGGIVLALVLQFAAAGNTPWTSYITSLAAPRDRQVASLRQLRGVAEAQDRIIDPSGLAYFVRPCTSEWYLDTLFQERAAQGLWMQELRRVDLTECPWMLNTYRLGMFPDDVASRLKGKYVLLNQGGGLALLEGDPRLSEVESWDPLAFTELYSFW